MTARTPKIVRYVPKPLTEEQIAELRALAERPDDEIDFSDIPEAGDEFFANAKRGTMYRAVKHQVTLRIDGDVIDWFKRQVPEGKGYQTDINRALREYMTAHSKKAG
jgi:uncharacterized protein (DUF4415 family)